MFGEFSEPLEVVVLRRRFLRGRGAAEHLIDMMGTVGNKVFDELGFREILPILLGHLGLHRFHFYAGDVEDAFIVGAPEVFEGVGVGGLAFIDPRSVADFLAIPMHALVVREDGPVHVGEAFTEEGRIEPDDFMIGLEP